MAPEQSAQSLESIKHTRTYWPVLVALATGMRRGEVLALRWKNVDLDRGTLRVMQSLEQTKNGLRFKDTKTSRVRAIILPAYAVEEFRRLKRQQAEELLALGIRQTGETLVCCRADGEPLQPRSLTHQFVKLREGHEGIYPACASTICGIPMPLNYWPTASIQRSPKSASGTPPSPPPWTCIRHVTDTMQADAAARLDAAFQTAKTQLKG